MATPKQNYAQQFRAYAEPSYIPSNVRSYSVFDPNSNSWRRMTNDGRSPMPVQGQTPVMAVQPMTPAQEQAAVAGALAQARQTQGMTYPVQNMIPTQTPGIFLRPKQQPTRQVIRPLMRSNTRTSVKPKISDYNNNDDAILRVADIPPEVTLGTQPTVRVTPVNMSPDHQTPIPYISNETAGLAGYNPNIAHTQTQLALGKHYRQAIPTQPLTVAEHLTRLFGGNKVREASNAMRAATGLPPLE